MTLYYDRTTLPNGLTVASERIPGSRSVSLGIWVGIGSRDEDEAQGGISHLMEHMLFKGTPTRTAEQISVDLDSIGAESNAFTSRECTCFFARMIDEHADEAFSILADMLVNSEFAPSCLESEREVVIEEIARSEDAPDDHVFDLAAEAAWPGLALGRPILGRREVVAGFGHDDLAAYHEAHYTLGNVVVAAAGNIEHDHLVELASRQLSGLPAGKRHVRGPMPERAMEPFAIGTKDTEQAHIVYTLPGIPADDPDRFAATVLDTVLGTGMSSRLFVEVRERRGLAYAISSYASSYQGAGKYSVYAGTRPANLAEVVSIIREQLARALSDGITDEEMARAKETVASQLILRNESTQQHMATIGRRELAGSEVLSVTEREQRIRAVTQDDVRRVAPRLLSGTPSIAVISPYEADEAREMIGRALEG